MIDDGDGRLSGNAVRATAAPKHDMNDFKISKSEART
jgi:hypothetical protein